jgi:hypothetical protein
MCSLRENEEIKKETKGLEAELGGVVRTSTEHYKASGGTRGVWGGPAGNGGCWLLGPAGATILPTRRE